MRAEIIVAPPPVASVPYYGAADWDSIQLHRFVQVERVGDGEVTRDAQ
jgi:hypothetical protein